MNSEESKLKPIKALFLGFPSQERTDNERELVKVYLMAVEGIPADLVAMACKRFIQAQVERANLTFRPTPAELAFEARRLRDKALELQRYDVARLPKPPSDERDPTPEERARAAELVRQFKAERAAAVEATKMTLKGRRYQYRQPTPDELAASRARIAAWEQEQEQQE